MTYRYKINALVLSITLIFTNVLAVYGKNTVDNNYTYDYWYSINKSIPTFELVRTIDEETLGVTVSGIDDVCTSKDRIFLIDTQESRLNIVDENYNFITSIKLIRNEENKIVTDPDTGNQMILTNPEGVWFHESEDEIFIADTGASRIIVLDGSRYFLKRVIERPDNMLGNTQFNPSKIIVDQANKIYFVVQSGFEGIVELDETGSFSRYFGVNKPVINFLDFFWKSISSDEQKTKMAKTFAPSFNNIDIDKDGFIYATTMDSAAQEMVFRLNPKGENVLRQEGYLPVQGDLKIQNKFVDIAINDYGVYAVLDQEKGRIFIYNFDGELIDIFNSNGNVEGNFKAASSIAWFGDVLVATDKVLGCAYIFEMTEFGEMALGATKHYYNGEWEESAKLSREAVRLNANYDLAYIGIGKYYLMKDDFKSAMHYFKLGNDKKFYSKAYNGYRNIYIQEHFIWILGIILIGAGLLIYSEVRYYRRGVGGK